MKTPTVRTIALVAVMAAVVCVLTYIVQIPIPATNGYFHLGDVAANFAALAFGPGPGFLIAGGGMAIADLLAGYATFAPGTFVIHGLQAVVVAIIGRNRKPWLMLLAAAAGGAVVVVGYLLYEWLILSIGLGVAVVEVLPNVLQVTSGLAGVPLFLLVVRAYPPLTRWVEQG